MSEPVEDSILDWKQFTFHGFSGCFVAIRCDPRLPPGRYGKQRLPCLNSNNAEYSERVNRSLASRVGKFVDCGGKLVVGDTFGLLEVNRWREVAWHVPIPNALRTRAWDWLVKLSHVSKNPAPRTFGVLMVEHFTNCEARPLNTL